VRRCIQTYLSSLVAGEPRQHEVAVESPDASTQDDYFARRVPSRSKPATPQGDSSKASPGPPSYIHRAFAATPPHPNPLRNGNSPRSNSTSFPDHRVGTQAVPPRAFPCARPSGDEHEIPDPTRVFKPLESYIITCFSSIECLDQSFQGRRGSVAHPSTDARKQRPSVERRHKISGSTLIPELDAKMLLLGDVAENGLWWTGGQGDVGTGKLRAGKGDDYQAPASTRPRRVEWSDLDAWYSIVINAASPWEDIYQASIRGDPTAELSTSQLAEVASHMQKSQEHAHRVLLKAAESVLKRPGRPIKEASDVRFLLILLANPLIHAPVRRASGRGEHGEISVTGNGPSQSSVRGTGPASGQHSGLIKRILGLIANSGAECHSYLVGLFARLPDTRFAQFKDLVSGFLAYRLLRQKERTRETKVDVTDGLIPGMAASQSPANLHAALGEPRDGVKKKSNEKPKATISSADWQIRVAVRVMSLLFAANNLSQIRRHHHGGLAAPSSRHSGRNRSQIMPTSDFYIALLDDLDVVAEFETWERQPNRFSFCQYPCVLSIFAKIRILEHEARRQMSSKARDAFFHSIMTRRVVDAHLTLSVRRECLVEDSLKAISEVIGGGTEEIKKGLRIMFRGEEGVDAGGLRKEWFLLLVREVFNPDHGKRCAHHIPAQPKGDTTDNDRHVCLRRGLAVLLLQPSIFRNVRSVLPHRRRLRARNLQLHDTRCRLPAFRLPQAPPRRPCFRNRVQFFVGACT
jgi:E3 ubiquitin-protein ligase HECTD2